LSSTPRCEPIDMTIGYGKSSSGWLRTNSMRISLLPGTPPAALSLRKYQCPLRLSSPSSEGNSDSSYKFYRSLLCGRSWRTYEIGLLVLHESNAGNVLDEWIFSCSKISGNFSPSLDNGHISIQSGGIKDKFF